MFHNFEHFYSLEVFHWTSQEPWVLWKMGHFSDLQLKGLKSFFIIVTDPLPNCLVIAHSFYKGSVHISRHSTSVLSHDSISLGEVKCFRKSFLSPVWWIWQVSLVISSFPVGARPFLFKSFNCSLNRFYLSYLIHINDLKNKTSPDLSYWLKEYHKFQLKLLT